MTMIADVKNDPNIIANADVTAIVALPNPNAGIQGSTSPMDVYTLLSMESTGIPIINKLGLQLRFDKF